MSRKRRPDPLANLRHPVGRAILKQRVQQQIRALQTEAALHALIGANDPVLVDRAGRLAYIAAEANRLCRLPDDSPEMRVIAGMSHALYELASGQGDRELHRLSISSGLGAVERLVARCNLWGIATAHLKLEELLAGEGLSIHHITNERATT
jgi:hypothetical protein